MKKRIISILLIMVVLFIPLLTACGGDSGNGTQNGGSAANGNDNPVNEPEPTPEPTPEETTKEPIIEDNKLYLSKGNLPIVIYDDFISNPELGIKVNLQSVITENFIDSIGLDYEKTDDNRYIFDGLIFGGTGNPNTYMVTFKTDKWTFNDNLKIGSIIEDVVEIYGKAKIATSYNWANHDGTENFSIRATYDRDREEPGAIVSESFNITSRPVRVPLLECENYLSVWEIKTSEPNTAGGVNIDIEYSNDSEKTIKYIDFYAIPYNAVDDAVKSEIGDISIIKLQITGPIEPSKYPQTATWETVWYNNTIKYAKLEYVKIIYMDNEEVTLYVE